jgi:hypothetical protein
LPIEVIHLGLLWLFASNKQPNQSDGDVAPVL